MLKSRTDRAYPDYNGNILLKITILTVLFLIIHILS